MLQPSACYWLLAHVRPPLSMLYVLCRCPSVMQLAAALPGRTPEECEELCQQYQTFLSLPHNQPLQTAFVAMVKDVHSNASGGTVSS